MFTLFCYGSGTELPKKITVTRAGCSDQKAVTEKLTIQDQQQLITRFTTTLIPLSGNQQFDCMNYYLYLINLDSIRH